MSGPPVLYHCPCTSAAAPPPNLPSSAYAFHDLSTLYFCEECDAIRCNRCVSVEVSTYYCPNCLFEVPSASVRGEKNRCARNCFQCPSCQNTVSVVPSDPASAEKEPFSTAASVGEPPYILYCNFCRWDSTIINLEFDKPTGLAVHLQKYEDNAIDQHELDRLRDHFEPLLRPLRSSTMFGASTSHHITGSSAAGHRRDVRGLRQSTRSHVRPQEKKDASADVHDYPPFKAFEFQRADENEEIAWLRTLTDVNEVAKLDQRTGSSWDESSRAIALRPLRVPLQSKKSKRCPTCRHILIKPEQKAQSTRFKIKLVAANYIPMMEVSKPQDSSLTSRRRTGIPPPMSNGAGSDYLQPGRTYQFQMAFTNPLYDPINLRLALQDQPKRLVDTTGARRPPFVVTLPTNTISVAAFTDTWDYEEDDPMADDDVTAQRPSSKEEKGRWKIGVVERRANVTKIGGELSLGKDAEGDIKFNLSVTYTYKAEDAQPEGADKTTAKEAVAAQLKTFAFWAVVTLGTVAPRARADDAD